MKCTEDSYVALADEEGSVQVKLLSDKGTVPKKANRFDAGFDLYSSEDKSIPQGTRSLISTDVAMAIPKGHVGLIWPRSGLAVKAGIDVFAGVIDAGYRGEVKVVLINLNKPSILDPSDPIHAINGDPNSVSVKPGDRIAQIIFEKITHFESWEEVSDISESSRGEGGFGSTGA